MADTGCDQFAIGLVVYSQQLALHRFIDVRVWFDVHHQQCDVAPPSAKSARDISQTFGLVLALVFILPSTALGAVLHIDADAHVTGKTA